MKNSKLIQKAGVITISYLLFFTLKVNAQVSWACNVVKVSNDTYELHLTATLNKPWHIYSQFMEEGGPIPIKVSIKANPSIELIDKVKEQGTLIAKHEQVFNIDVRYYEDKLVLIQEFKVIHSTPAQLNGSVNYMLCESSHCKPPVDYNFTAEIK